jgi:hypothetical protein
MDKLPWTHLISGRSYIPIANLGYMSRYNNTYDLSTLLSRKEMWITYYIQFGRNKYKPEEFQSGKHYDLIDDILAAVTLKGQVTPKSGLGKSLIKKKSPRTALKIHPVL